MSFILTSFLLHIIRLNEYAIFYALLPKEILYKSRLVGIQTNLKDATQQKPQSSRAGCIKKIISSKNVLKKIFHTGICITCMQQSFAQDISFFHLTAANGLSNNLVNTVARDKYGFVWIGTGNGLNCYDGFTVRRFFKKDFPELGSNDIRSLACDDKNRIWVTTGDNTICMLDENRQFRKVKIKDKVKAGDYFFLLQSRSRGIVFKNGSKLYQQKQKDKLVFDKIAWQEDTALQKSFVRWRNWDEDRILFSGNNSLCLFDVKNLRVIYNMQVMGIVGAARLNDSMVLATSDSESPLLKINLHTKEIVRNYSDIKDQYGESINNSLLSIRRLSGEKFIITSGYAGVYIFDMSSEKLFHYPHDPLNERSVSANNTFYVYTDSGKYFFVTTRTAGLNYFNVNLQLAGYQPSFADNNTGAVFDGYVTSIVRSPNGTLLLGTQSRLIEWKREQNQISFKEYGTIKGKKLNGAEEVRALCFDKQDRLWVGTSRYGIIVLDKNNKPVKYLDANNNGNNNYLPGNYINQISLSPFDNKMWIATTRGLCVIDPETFAVHRLTDNAILNKLNSIACNTVWFRNKNETWIGTSNGAYCYHASENTLEELNAENGLSHNNVFCFADDANGNVYIGTGAGLNRVSPERQIKIFGTHNGLRNEKCDGLLKDKNGNIWIGNDNCLIQFKPFEDNFTVYDESAGLSNAGFRPHAYLQTSNGEIIWGSNRGINYFNPEKLQQLQVPLQVIITSPDEPEKKLGFLFQHETSLPYLQNSLLFSFSAIDLYSSKNILYEYKLEGVDTVWKRTWFPRQVAYSKLEPGDYIFNVRASRNGMDWVNAINPVSVHIKMPWYRSWLFLSLDTVLIIITIIFFIKRRNKKIEDQKEQLETEKAINYFASSMNEQNMVEDILWDVTRNCISRLHFEDCVIYIIDEDENVLIQKAAWGPKITHENKIVNPLKLPLGTGICGCVALSGKTEIIADTSKDDRYIVDDARRFSEICVPIIYNGKVLGVIDSEHSKKNFFKQKHVSILTTIASLCANKILRARTEEEKQKTQLELMHTIQRAAETELYALRAQMNPHFMFNSLNSINNFILKNDTEKASEYLTKFSQLMRMILDNSRQEWVLLENELKCLQLYIELEAVRLKNSFSYSINIDQRIKSSVMMVPPMIIQPYVENAIWHGLLHRDMPGGFLKLQVMQQNDMLYIQVEDNGVGREEAEKLKSRFASHKKSHGMKITAERLDIINKTYKTDIHVSVSDVKNNGHVSGTKVLITLKNPSL